MKEMGDSDGGVLAYPESRFLAPRLGLFSLDPLVNFFPVHGDVFGSIDAQSHLMGADVQYRHANVVANYQGLANPPR